MKTFQNMGNTTDVPKVKLMKPFKNMGNSTENFTFTENMCMSSGLS